MKNNQKCELGDAVEYDNIAQLYWLMPKPKVEVLPAKPEALAWNPKSCEEQELIIIDEPTLGERILADFNRRNRRHP